MTLATLELPSSEALSVAVKSVPSAATAQPEVNMLARAWFALAFVALVIAGVFAFVPVIGRTPGLSGLIKDPV